MATMDNYKPKRDINEIREAIKCSSNIAEVCRKLGWTTITTNYKIVRRYINEYNIDISHFNKNYLKTNIGNRLNKDKNIPLCEILTKNSYYSTNTIKRRLIYEGVKQYKCEVCGLSKWNDKQIGLQLHHINGDNTDNRLENLQLLCPNCHSQTENFCKRSSKRSKIIYCLECLKVIDGTKTGYCDDCFEKLINGELDKPHTTSITPVFYLNDKGDKLTCKECGQPIYKTNESQLCRTCYDKHRKNIKITKSELDEMYKTMSTKEIAQKYGCTVQCIRKIYRQ